MGFGGERFSTSKLPFRDSGSASRYLLPLEVEDEIRLVNLTPGAADYPLSCTISHQRLAKKPVYQALSYVWGVQDALHSISVNGSQLPIGKNLRDALLRLRASENPTLWVDKICINQDDLSERAQQVCLMDSIYFKASRVRIWLGESNTDTKQAYSLLENIYKLFFSQPGKSELSDSVRQALTGGRTLSKAYMLPDAESTEWIPIANLMTRPWFSRAWTFQEVVAAGAADVLCGAFSMPWETFSQSLLAIKQLQRHYTGRRRGPFFDIQTEVPLQMMTSKENLAKVKVKHKFVGAMDLARLLEVRRIAASTDARDKLFSLLNISSDRFNPGALINYTWDGGDGKSWQSHRSNYTLTISELYTIAARHTTGLDQKLGILLNVECPKYDSDLPSWVPDWRADLTEPFRKPELTGQLRPYGATGNSKVKLRDNESSIEHDSNHIHICDLQKLVLQGFYVDTIVSVSNNLGPSDFGDFRATISANKEWKALADKVAAKGKYVPTDEEMSQAYTRTRLGDIWPAPERWVAGTRLPDHKTFIYKASPGNMANLAFTRAMEHCGQRRFFTTKLGYIGFGPATVKEGDVVFLLLGGKVPFALRSTSPSSSPAAVVSGTSASSKQTDMVAPYSFVGETYTHGLMDGEGLLKARPEQHRSTDASRNYKWLYSFENRVPDVEGLQWIALELAEAARIAGLASLTGQAITSAFTLCTFVDSVRTVKPQRRKMVGLLYEQIRVGATLDKYDLGFVLRGGFHGSREIRKLEKVDLARRAEVTISWVRK